MAKIIKLRGPIRELTVAVGAYSVGGGACSPRVGAYSRGGFFRGGGGNSRIYGTRATAAYLVRKSLFKRLFLINVQ